MYEYNPIVGQNFLMSTLELCMTLSQVAFGQRCSASNGKVITIETDMGW